MNHEFSIDGLFDFLNAGVSAFHSTAAAAAILEENGYQNCPESAAWQLAPGGKYYTTRNGSAIMAWRMPKGPLTGKKRISMMQSSFIFFSLLFVKICA